MENAKDKGKKIGRRPITKGDIHCHEAAFADRVSPYTQVFRNQRSLRCVKVCTFC